MWEYKEKSYKVLMEDYVEVKDKLKEIGIESPELIVNFMMLERMNEIESDLDRIESMMC